MAAKAVLRAGVTTPIAVAADVLDIERVNAHKNRVARHEVVHQSGVISVVLSRFGRSGRAAFFVAPYAPPSNERD
jgi:hypothetical protein